MTEVTSAAHQAAIGYAERGWAVIPLHWATDDGCSCAGGPHPCDGASAGKHPLRKRWASGPRLSGADLHAIWAEDSPLANVGIRTGVVSGFWVLDVDPKSGGFESLATLTADLGPLPATYVVRTGSGGYHYYFALPDFAVRNGANRELLRRYGPGLDIRGDGGQVVAPPSSNAHGGYAVKVDGPVLRAPAALEALLQAAGDVAGPDTGPVEDLPAAEELDGQTAARVQAYAQRVLEIVVAEYRDAVPGAGNETLFRSACSALEIAQSPWNTVTAAAAHGLLHAAARARRAVHPYGGGQADGEFEQTWGSARNRTVGQGRALPVNLSEGTVFDPFPHLVTDDPFRAPATSSELPSDAPPADAGRSGTDSSVASSPVPTGSTTTRSDHTLPTLPAELYARRAWLTELRRMAHERMVAPDAVLGSYLTIAASQMPAGLHLHTSIGAPITASLFTVMVGPSGTGKTAGTAVASQLYRERVVPRGLSTGEGLIEAFWGLRKAQDEETLKFTTERMRTSANQLFVLDEGKALAQMAGRVGNITGEVLRTAWSGGDVGQHNATRELQRQLDARTYNLGLVMGMQPEVAAGLLADTSTGMAQRFLWFSVLDPEMPLLDGDDRPFADVLSHSVHPDYVAVSEVEWIGGAAPDLGGPSRVMTLAPTIRTRLREARWRTARGETATEEHDSQRVVAVGKLAMVLAYLDGANSVGEDVWDLASQVYDGSAAVRDQLMEMEAERDRDERRAVAHDRARHDADVKTYPQHRAELAIRVLELVAAGVDTRRAILKTANTRRRSALGEALDLLVQAGYLTAVDEGRGRVTYAGTGKTL